MWCESSAKELFLGKGLRKEPFRGNKSFLGKVKGKSVSADSAATPFSSFSSAELKAVNVCPLRFSSSVQTVPGQATGRVQMS